MMIIGRFADPERHCSTPGGSFFHDEKQIHLAAALALRLACQGHRHGHYKTGGGSLSAGWVRMLGLESGCG